MASNLPHLVPGEKVVTADVKIVDVPVRSPHSQGPYGMQEERPVLVRHPAGSTATTATGGDEVTLVRATSSKKSVRSDEDHPAHGGGGGVRRHRTSANSSQQDYIDVDAE